MSSTDNHKAVLRKSMLEKRNNLSDLIKRRHSQRICKKLLEYILKHEINSLHTFLPIGSEIDIIPVVQECLSLEIIIIIPKTLSNRSLEHHQIVDLRNLKQGRFGTKYPKDPNLYHGSYDLILVPGLAFDLRGNRIGYGAGYYDVFLQQHPTATKAGVCFPEQIIDQVPFESHDVNMDLMFC